MTTTEDGSTVATFLPQPPTIDTVSRQWRVREWDITTLTYVLDRHEDIADNLPSLVKSTPALTGRLTRAPTIIKSAAAGLTLRIRNEANLMTVVRVATAPNTVTVITGSRACGTFKAYVFIAIPVQAERRGRCFGSRGRRHVRDAYSSHWQTPECNKKESLWFEC